MKGISLRVGDVIRGMLPNGSDQAQKSPTWTQAPIWTPDLFAIAATLIEKSSCYAEPGIAFSKDAKQRAAKQRRALRAQRIGGEWANKFGVPARVQALWRKLLSAEHDLVCCGTGGGRSWKLAAMELLAIADEACAGMGYQPSRSDGLANFLWQQLIAQYSGRQSPLQLPNSLTHLVPADVACVMPKAMTADVGCTLRSLSHNLALLPGIGCVQTEWSVDSARESSGGRTEDPFNVLLVPFPYVVRASDFAVSRPATAKFDGYFFLKQNWLWHGGKKVRPAAFAQFLIELIREAEKECGAVHALVFPEASLDQNTAIGIGKLLAKKAPRLELMICGTLGSDGNGTRNEAALLRFDEGQIADTYVQSKHHRWKLDGPQIKRYQLGDKLDPEFKWWEDIAVDDRKIRFGVNRHEAVIATLVCEDLARHDPVLGVLTAVGPSLVVALLMDGPQFEARWSGRYATALADDPGCSVLTITSVGMIDRFNPTGPGQRVIGLWKDRTGQAVQLVLPPANHGVILSLKAATCEQTTMDHRSDGGSVVEYRLGLARAVAVKKIPQWLDR